MKQAAQKLQARLAEIQRRWLMVQAAAGTLAMLALAVSVLLAAALADNLCRADALRWLGGGLTLAALLAGAWRWLWRPLRGGGGADAAALLAERKAPGLGNILINGLQFSRGERHGSPEIVATVIEDAARAATSLNPADCVERRPLRHAARAAAAAAALALFYALVAPGWFVNGVGRVLAPWADLPAYAATRVVAGSIKPGNVRVPEGATVELEAAVEGRKPESATWRWVSDGQTGRSATVAAGDDARNVFRYAQSNVIVSFAYFLEAGDGRSQTHRVEVVPRPRVKRVTTSVRLPDYTGGGERVSRDPDGGAHAPVGSQARIELCATKPLKAAWLQWEDGHFEKLPLARAADDDDDTDRVWRGAVWLWSADARMSAPTGAGAAVVMGPARFRVILADTDGYETSDPVWRDLLPERDQRPAVALPQPGRDVQAHAGETIPVTIEASDDFGVASATLLAKVNDATQAQTVAVFRYPVPGAARVREVAALALPALGVKPGDLVHVWAVAEDHNTLTGPGRGETRAFTVVVTQGREAELGADLRLEQALAALETILRLQQQNRGAAATGLTFAPLTDLQITIRVLSAKLARALERGPLPLETLIQALDRLTAGPMAEAVRLCETGRDAAGGAAGAAAREQVLPVMDRIITALQELLARLQKDEEARRALRGLGKRDPLGQKAIVDVLTNMVSHLDRMTDETRAATNRFEKMPKRGTNETTDASADGLRALQALQEKWSDWTKGTIDDLAKLPSGFIDDFGLRADTKRLYEEIEAATNRPKTVKMEIAWEDTAPGLATRMKEDLEMWMPDAPDNVKWVLEDPLKGTQPMEIPEMPLPDRLEDMIGDLLQKADEFDQAAEDATSMIGDNLDQAGWGVGDGPMSTFSAKGKTGNDLPNANEVNGRSGDGRRGQTGGQMVGDTARGLDGRKTPARLTAEKYEPGTLKQTGRLDPNGATGGGKKAGAGARGLQGGTPPDFVKMQERLEPQLKGLREKAEQVARDLEKLGVVNRRLNAGIGGLRALEQSGRDLRYSDAARHRRVALDSLTGALVEIDQSTAVQWNRAVRLPEPLRDEIVQAAGERFPEGYEDAVKRYFRTLSDSEGQ